MQEQRIDDCWKVDENRSLSDSWIGFTKFTLMKETPPKGHMWSGKRLIKVQTTTRPDQVWPEVWTNLSKQSSAKTRKTRMGKWEAEARERAQIERNILHWPGRPIIWRDYKECKKKVESAHGSGHAVQEEKPKTFALSGNWGGAWSTQQSSKDQTRMCSGVSWIHKTANGTDSSKRSWRPDRCNTRELYEPLQLSARTNSYAESEVILEAQRNESNVHFASVMDLTHLKNSELESTSRSTQVELYFVDILWKMILELVKCLLNRAHLHHRWRPQRSWMSLWDYQIVTDKQPTQYLLVPQ